jgi:hypothetical protein
MPIALSLAMNRSLAFLSNELRLASNPSLVLGRPHESESRCESESSGHNVRWLEDGESAEKHWQALETMLGVVVLAGALVLRRWR